MFPSSAPWLYTVQMILTTLVILACLLLTGNPLALMGLMLMWSSPPTVTPCPKQIAAGMTAEAEVEAGGEDDDPKIGFMAK